MCVNLPLYKLPRGLRKQVLLDCYNALIGNGIPKDEARHKISHEITCARLCDLEHLVDVRKYDL